MKHVIKVVNRQIMMINEFAGLKERINPQYKDYVEGVLFDLVDDDTSIEDLMGTIVGMCELVSRDDPLVIFIDSMAQVLVEEGMLNTDLQDEEFEEEIKYYYGLFHKRLLTLSKEVKVSNYTTAKFKKLLMNSRELFPRVD